MSFQYGTLALYVPELTIAYVPEPTIAEEEAYDTTINSWSEISAGLPPQARSMAEEFVRLCEESGAFLCDPGCAVDVVEEGHVLFDWNSGESPIFSVMVTAAPSVAYVGKFKDGKVTGEETTLGWMDGLLSRLVGEFRNKKWTKTTPSRALSLNEASSSLSFGVGPHYTSPQAIENSRFSPQEVPHALTLPVPGSTLQSEWRKSRSMAGPT